jgi:predicted nucleic acid-binding protein
MSLYIDSSALLKRYLDEEHSAHCDEVLSSDEQWLTARHTWVEVLRNLARLLDGSERTRMEAEFRQDWQRFSIVELDVTTCEIAADIAATHGLRTLDALHLAAAQRAGGSALPILTYDLKQASVARALGFPVVAP